jgi:2,3-bisphosphoglycerate-dependent phosphoglycerate mutase
MPRTECLRDVVGRLLPYWYDAIVPDLAAGHTVLIAAHGNSLRALVKHLDGIGDEAIAALNIPTGIPLLYELDASFRPVVPGGRYLDPEAAVAAAEAVKNQGR